MDARTPLTLGAAEADRVHQWLWNTLSLESEATDLRELFLQVYRHGYDNANVTSMIVPYLDRGIDLDLEKVLEVAREEPRPPRH